MACKGCSEAFDGEFDGLMEGRMEEYVGEQPCHIKRGSVETWILIERVVPLMKQSRGFGEICACYEL
jgi:hypothetical protein